LEGLEWGEERLEFLWPVRRHDINVELCISYLRRLIRIPHLEQAEQGPFRPADPLALVCILRRECLYSNARPVLPQVKVQQAQISHEESDIGRSYRVQCLRLRVCFDRHGARMAIGGCRGSRGRSGGGSRHSWDLHECIRAAASKKPLWTRDACESCGVTHCLPRRELVAGAFCSWFDSRHTCPAFPHPLNSHRSPWIAPLMSSI
jgi:hypothetical protein